MLLRQNQQQFFAQHKYNNKIILFQSMSTLFNMKLKTTQNLHVLFVRSIEKVGEDGDDVENCRKDSIRIEPNRDNGTAEDRYKVYTFIYVF